MFSPLTKNIPYLLLLQVTPDGCVKVFGSHEISPHPYNASSLGIGDPAELVGNLGGCLNLRLRTCHGLSAVLCIRAKYQLHLAHHKLLVQVIIWIELNRLCNNTGKNMYSNSHPT